MAQTAKFDDSDSADDLGIVNVPMPLSHREPFSNPDHHRHRCPVIPPAAAGVMKRAKSLKAKSAIRPLAPLPPVPPVPVLATTGISAPPVAPPKMIDATVAALPARTRSRPKTLLERIEGWWDLGLLDKRQTLFRSQSRGMAEQKV